MTKTQYLDKQYSTTRLLTQEKPNIITNPEDKFESVLILPIGENRNGEGGLRTKGYFKKSYEDKPLISIITVVYNGEKYLEETIISVINQTYDNVEYIIIDGGSSDATLDIIKKYEERIDYWVSEKDKGIYDAMNKGIDVASGEWINFMNAGDGFVNKNSIKIFSKYLDSAFALIYSDILIKNQITSEFTEHKQPIFKTWYGNYKMLCHQSILFNKKILIKFNIKYKISADFDLLLSLFKRKKLFSIHIQKPLISYLDGGCSGNDVLHSIQERMNIINEQESFLFKLIGRLNYYRLQIKFANKIKLGK